MTGRPRLVFVEQYYFPEGWGGAQIPRDITSDLADSGYPVSVVCGHDQYVPIGSDWCCDLNQDPRSHGVTIWYVPKIGPLKRRTKNVLRQLWFSTSAFAFVMFRARRSILIVQTNPPLVVIAAGAMAALLRRPVILIAQDLYPEVMIAHGMMKPGSTASKILVALFRWAYRRADYVISLGPTMTQRLVEKGVDATRIRQISNWATGDLHVERGLVNPLREDWGLIGKFVLLYSGNLGIAHDIETVIRALSIVQSSLPQLRLVIVGEGARVAEAKSIAQQLAVADRVMFRPFVTDHQLPLSMGLADLGLVTLLPGFEGLVVPSKLLGQMARGIPTVYVGPRNSDVAELIAESCGGISIENGKASDLAERLIELVGQPKELAKMGASARAYYASNLDRNVGLESYRSVVSEVVDSRSLTSIS